MSDCLSFGEQARCSLEGSSSAVAGDRGSLGIGDGCRVDPRNATTGVALADPGPVEAERS